MTTFIFFLLGAIACFIWFLGFRIIHRLENYPRIRGLGWALLLFTLFFSPVVYNLRSRNITGELLDMVTWAGYLLMGFASIALFFAVVKDLGLGIHTIVRKVSNNSKGGKVPENPHRRSLMINAANAGIFALSGSLTTWGVVEASQKPQIVTMKHRVKDAPGALDGVRIVQITDVHVSATFRKKRVQEITRAVMELDPHIIVFTGDLADGPVSMLRDDTSPLGDLHAPLGKFFVTGNHEYYSNVHEWTSEIKRLGFTVLHNENTLIKHGKGRLLLAGVTDYTGGQFFRDHASDPVKAMEGAPSSHYKILLAHQPKSVPKAVQAGFDLQLSGHTHGGQYFPYIFAVTMDQPYVAGLYNVGDTDLYVSRGTGYWGPPMRVGSPAEITLHILTS